MKFAQGLYKYICNPKLWLVVRLLFLIASIYFFFSAILALKKYSTNVPYIALSEKMYSLEEFQRFLFSVH